jgi:hypothetical protein
MELIDWLDVFRNTYEPAALATIRTFFYHCLIYISLLWLVLVFPFLHDEIVFPNFCLLRGKNSKNLIFRSGRIDTRAKSMWNYMGVDNEQNMESNSQWTSVEVQI